MLEKTKLEEISLELPEQERRDLLERITRSLEAESPDGLVRVELRNEEREKLLGEEMQALSAWVRFVLWLTRLFSGRSRREAFLNWKIKQLKRRIRSRSSGLTGFESRDLSGKFGRLFYELYREAFPLRQAFRDFHTEEDLRDRAVLRLFEHNYPDAKKTLEDFVPLEEMERIYADSGREDEVRRACLGRFGEYTKRIPDRLTRHLDDGMRPLFFLKNLVLFPFSTVLRQFKVETVGAPDDRVPDFQPAAAMLVLDQLERLYHAVNLPAELGADWFFHEEVFQAYLEHARPEEQPEALEREEEARNAAELSATVPRLVDAARRFSERVPLLDLIRYFRKDPYYRIVFAVPRYHTKPVYASALRQRLLDQLEERIDQVKKTVLERRLAEIFKNGRLVELFHYVERPDSEYSALGLPVFRYTMSLKVLSNYLARLYKPTIQDAVQAANMYVLAGNRIAQARLNQSAAGLEELEAKIVLLDRSLSPDEDDGKTLLRLRHRLATDLNQQKLYRAFVTQKDREARELIDQGYDYLLGIQRLFEELLSSPAENLKSILRTLHFFRGRNVTLSGLLRGTADLVSDFLELLTQVLELEKGS
jgi:hypothetical protein